MPWKGSAKMQCESYLCGASKSYEVWAKLLCLNSPHDTSMPFVEPWLASYRLKA